MNTTIKIENLKCNGCASTIKKGLLKFDEVTNAEINISNSTVTITFVGNEDTIQDFKNKLSSLGYPESGNNSRLLAAKSFVSCAIGRINPIVEK